MNNTMDWSLVRSFLAAIEHGSLMGAARALGVSQPTVGRHISDLEMQLGVALFERTGRGMVPTEVALQLVDSARAMQNSALQLERAVSGRESTVYGTVRISASQVMACTLLPRVFTRMRETLPHVQVELVASNQVTNLLRREADIALRMLAPDQSSLIARKIGEFTLGCYAHRDYLVRRGTPVEPEDLLTHDLIGRAQDDNIIRGFAAMGYVVSNEDFSFRTDDHIAYWEAVRAGLGVGFLANFLGQSDPALQQLLPSLQISPLPVWLTVHREIRGNQRIRAVYDYLAVAVAEELTMTS